MSTKIDKIIARLKQRTTEGQYYEAQLQTRAAAARYAKQANYIAAIDILFNVAESLLKAGQGGSGGDLSLFLVEVYQSAELKPDAKNKGRLLTLLRLFEAEEPTRKKFIGEMIGWSAKFGEYPAGEPELHHVAGTLYAEEKEAYEAERHLILGTKDSPESLARLEYEWYMEDESHTAALYASRAVLPYLLIGNVRDAFKSLRLFNSRLSDSSKNLGVQDISSNSSDMRIYPSLPLLNFLGLLLLAVQKGSADIYRQIKGHYAPHLKDVPGWNDALDLVAEMYFGIQKPKQGNPLFDMMGSIFGGGPAPKKQETRRIDSSSAAPVAEGLD